MAIKLYSQQRTSEEYRKSEQKQPDGVRRYRTLDAQPRGAHGEDRNRNGLKNRALPIFRPTPVGVASPGAHGKISDWVRSAKSINMLLSNSGFVLLK